MAQYPESMDSKFRFVLVASNRAEQLMRGANPKIDSPSAKPTVVAMREVEKGMIEWGYGPEPASSDNENTEGSGNP